MVKNASIKNVAHEKHSQNKQPSILIHKQKKKIIYVKKLRVLSIV